MFKKLYNYFPYILIVLSFGIYLLPGIRIEQIFLYGFFLLFLLVLFTKNFEVAKHSLFVTFIYTSIFIITTSVSILKGGSGIIAGIESTVLPLTILIILSVLIIREDIDSMQNKLIKVSKILVFMLCLNTLWSITNIVFDLRTVNVLFWGSEENVATRALGNSRFSGVFNQPMEAGIAYSLGLIAWLYLSEKIKITKMKYVISLVLLILGGVFTVSKIFLFGGLGIFIIGVILNRNIWRLIGWLLFWSLILVAPIIYWINNTWTGVRYLTRFFGDNSDLLSLLTAGRFTSGGGQSQQVALFSDVWNRSPLLGDGFGFHSVYDSAFFYFFANGGTLALSLYLILLLILSLLALNYLIGDRMSSEAKFFAFIIILLIGASIGAPVLNLNRVGAIITVLIALLLQYFHIKKYLKTSQ